MSQMNMNEMIGTQIGTRLETLLEEGRIVDYTTDGWLRIHDEWVPWQIGFKQLGDDNDCE